jgi:hypothetical protein
MEYSSMYSQESNWKHRKGGCGEGVGVYHVQPTVQLEAARKGSCGTDSSEELVNPYKPGPNMNSNVGTDISVQVVRLITQDSKVVQQRCQKPEIYERFHELKLTKHAEGPLDVKRA